MPVEPETARELVHRIFDLQRIVRCVASAELRGSERGGELGVASQGVLRMIDEHGGRAVDLAGKLGVSAPVLSRHLAELEALGCIERRRDPEDRRAQLLALTESGRDLLAQIEEHRTERLRAYLADWDEQRAADAAVVLGQLSRALRDGARGTRAGAPATTAEPATTAVPATTEKEHPLAAR